MSVQSPDGAAKRFLEKPDIFASIFNYAIFGGERIIEPNTLNPVDRLFEEYLPESQRSLVRSRDLFKSTVVCHDDKSYYVLLGIESQSHIHYAMPVRSMIYDGLSYAVQIRQQKHQSATHRTSDEFLSGMGRDDRLIPVVTLVVYFGTKEWDGPVTLRDMMAKDVSPAVISMVPDYPIHLISPQNLTDSALDLLDDDLKKVMGFLKYSRNNAAMEDFMKKLSGNTSVSWEASQVIESVTGIKMDQSSNREDKVNMCQAWMERLEEGKTIASINNVQALMHNLGIDANEAMNLLDIPDESREHLLESISSSADE